MDSFIEEKTITVFCDDLSLSFNKFIIVPLVKEFMQSVEEQRDSITPNWKFELTKTIDKLELLEEWIVFEMFLYGQSILEYFKGNLIGKKIVRTFNRNLIDSLVEFKVIQNEEEFENFLSERYSNYLAILKKGESNELYQFSKDILSVICRGDSNIIYITVISSYYFDTSLMYKKLFLNIMKEVKLID